MKLYEICSQITIQGNIAIKLFNDQGEEMEAWFFRNQDYFTASIPELHKIKYLEVKYIYPMDLYRGEQWLVIEVAEENEY